MLSKNVEKCFVRLIILLYKMIYIIYMYVIKNEYLIFVLLN